VRTSPPLGALAAELAEAAGYEEVVAVVTDQSVAEEFPMASPCCSTSPKRARPEHFMRHLTGAREGVTRLLSSQFWINPSPRTSDSTS